jgi:hypothetical protein
VIAPKTTVASHIQDGRHSSHIGIRFGQLFEERLGQLIHMPSDLNIELGCIIFAPKTVVREPFASTECLLE